ncbi:hypothetical protein Pfo_010722 [Paulownia fortunei]|nr:hypothetical protein Pfo_010722 [Paulownia fortunei]
MATVATTGGSRHHGSREARRRRIVERGSDRLALITGRIQSLPSDTDPDPDQSSSPTCPPGQTPADVAQHEHVAASGSSLPNHESGGEPGQRHIFDETVEPLLDNSDKGRSITSGPVALLGVEEELSQISSSMQSPMQDHQREQSHRNSLTTGQISSAIAASENVRMCCSVAAAILVILSYMGFPILGCCIIRSIIIFRPLYLLFLTNISIVLARLILGTQGAGLRMGQMSTVPTFGGNALVYDQLRKALESGLLVHNIFGALFMDFSIYAVVLICGLSLVRRLGW